MGQIAEFTATLKMQLEGNGLTDATAQMDIAQKSGSALDSVMNHFVFTLGDVMNVSQKFASGLYSLIDAAAGEESSMNALAVAMKAQGVYTDDALQANLDFAQSQEDVTTFSHEQIEAVMKLFTNLGLHDEELRKATTSTLQLGAATGSLDTASSAMARAYEGITSRVLNLYGVDIPKGITGTEALNFATSQLADKLGNTAQGEAETYNGKMKQLNNSLNDLKEAYGKPLLNNMKDFIDFVKEGAKEIEEDKPIVEAYAKLLSGALIDPVKQAPTIWNSGFESLKQTYQDFVNFCVWDAKEQSKAIKAANDDILRDAKDNDAVELAIKKASTTTKITLSNSEAAAKIKAAQTAANEATKLQFAEDKAEAKSVDAYMKDKDREAAKAAETNVKQIALEQKRGDFTMSQELAMLINLEASCDSKSEAYQEYANKIIAIEGQINSEKMQFLGNFTGAFSTALADMIKGTVNFSDGIKELSQGLLSSVVNVIAEMTAKWLVAHAAMMAGYITEGEAKQMVAYADIPFAGIALGLAGAAALAMTIRGFAKGGSNISEGWGVVGEDGPEVAYIPQGTSIFSNSTSQAMLAGVGGMSIVIHANGPANREFARQIGSEIMTKINRNIKW